MIESLIKIIPAGLSFVTKIFFSGQKQKDFTLLEGFFKEENWKTMHDFALSDRFSKHRGKSYDASVIRYLLSFPESKKLFSDFDNGRKYLDAVKILSDNKYTVQKMTLQESLIEEKKFQKKIRENEIWYGICFLLGSLPLIFFPNLFSFEKEKIILFVLWLTFWYVGAYYMYDDKVALESAQRISELQIKENKC